MDRVRFGGFGGGVWDWGLGSFAFLSFAISSFEVLGFWGFGVLGFGIQMALRGIEFAGMYAPKPVAQRVRTLGRDHTAANRTQNLKPQPSTLEQLE